MGDDVFVGYLGIIGTIIGVIIGFGLSKISDLITAKRERQRNKNLLYFKLCSLKTKIATITECVNRLDKITDQKSITAMNNFLVGQNIREEISKLESVTDKIVNSNYNESDRVFFARVADLKFHFDFLLNLNRIHNDDPQDEKPSIILSLKAISEDIDYLSQDK